jgi:hypothetical protein
MDAYDKCTNLGKKILSIALPSLAEAEKFSDHPRNYQPQVSLHVGVLTTLMYINFMN